jgi:predicted nuclease of predicted toxin-antitoxin system
MIDIHPKFIVDECTGPYVASWLQKKGFDVLSVFEAFPGIKDTEILTIAQSEDRIIITNDKDFGEMVFKSGYSHHGIVLLRLNDERSENKITVLEKLLTHHSEDLIGNFIVLTENTIRIIRKNAF